MAKKMETGSSRIDTLRDRLVEMASMMGEEELEHLVDQAESWVQARKLQVERRALGETLERLGTGQRVNAPKGKAEPSVEVVENPSGQSFIIVMNNERTFMPLDEMRRLVGVCHKAEDAADGAKRLFTWFSRNRIEVIRNTGLAGPGDPHLRLLYEYVVSHYSVKEGNE